MEDRLKRGLKKLQEVDGKAGDDVVNSMNDIFPDLVKYMICLLYTSPSPRDCS
mgnify:CR=1 FL=1